MPTQLAAPIARKKMTTRTKVALLLLIGPSALLFITMLGFTLVNVVFGIAIPNQDSAFMPNPYDPIIPEVVTRILNMFLYACASIGILTWLPGVITGIVLLVTQKPTTPAQS